MLDFIILGFLMERSMSGYDIKQHMAISTSNFFDASFGSIYPALKRLEDRGFIACRETVEGAKFKKYYEILDEGRKEFLDWLAKPVEFACTSQEHLVRLFFYEYLPGETVRELLKHFIESVKAYGEKLDRIGTEIENAAGYYMFSTLRFGKDFVSFILEWYENMLEGLEESER